MFAWLTKCGGIGNGCGCLSWGAAVWEGFISFLSPCVRGGSVSTPGPGSRVRGRAFVVQQTRRQRVSLGAVLQNTPTGQRDFTNKQNTASTCVFLLSLCFHMLLWSLHSLFFHFSATFLSFALLLPVSGFAHPLKSPCEFFTHASAMSFPGAQVPPARAAPSVPLKEDAATIRGNH